MKQLVHNWHENSWILNCLKLSLLQFVIILEKKEPKKIDYFFWKRIYDLINTHRTVSDSRVFSSKRTSTFKLRSTRNLSFFIGLKFELKDSSSKKCKKKSSKFYQHDAIDDVVSTVKPINRLNPKSSFRYRLYHHLSNLILHLIDHLPC